MATVDNKHHAAGEVFDDTSGLRIIDLSDFEARKDEIAGQLISSAEDVGFFFVKGAAMRTHRSESSVMPWLGCQDCATSFLLQFSCNRERAI